MTPRPRLRTFSEVAMVRQQRMSAAKLALFDVREHYGLTVLEWLAVLGSEIESCATAYRRDTEPDEPGPARLALTANVRRSGGGQIILDLDPPNQAYPAPGAAVILDGAVRTDPGPFDTDPVEDTP